MAEPFLGEIRMFAGNYAPRHWALCDGQLLPVINNEALFSLFGTRYGGDGRTTFGLPDLRGRLPMHQGQGPGLTSRQIGQRFGVEAVTLKVDEIPPHSHPMIASSNNATSNDPAGNVLANTAGEKFYHTDTSKIRKLLSGAVANSGTNASHYNLMPSICLNFIVAVFGTYPPRN